MFRQRICCVWLSWPIWVVVWLDCQCREMECAGISRWSRFLTRAVRSLCTRCSPSALGLQFFTMICWHPDWTSPSKMPAKSPLGEWRWGTGEICVWVLHAYARIFSFCFWTGCSKWNLQTTFLGVSNDEFCPTVHRSFRRNFLFRGKMVNTSTKYIFLSLTAEGTLLLLLNYDPQSPMTDRHPTSSPPPGECSTCPGLFRPGWSRTPRPNVLSLSHLQLITWTQQRHPALTLLHSGSTHVLYKKAPGNFWVVVGGGQGVLAPK